MASPKLTLEARNFLAEELLAYLEAPAVKRQYRGYPDKPLELAAEIYPKLLEKADSDNPDYLRHLVRSRTRNLLRNALNREKRRWNPRQPEEGSE